MPSQNVLVAGGAGYVGSHTVKLLKKAGHNPVIYDNLSKGHRKAIEILGVPAVIAELDDRKELHKALVTYKIDTVMHFAAFADVGESVRLPLNYYRNNVATSVNVLETMLQAGVFQFVFSSTCAVYGDPTAVPIVETEKKAPVSPYGLSKWMVEQVLADLSKSEKRFKSASLRYFNASGCAPDGSLGECHRPENHLIPVVLECLLGLREKITIFGTDYPTPDGTNLRDYVHVEDLGDAHILAMEKLKDRDSFACNLGTGRGFSVKEIISAAEKVAGKKATVVLGPRRPGDAAALFADPSEAKKALGWEAKFKDPEAIIRTAWNWHSKNPNGYPKV